MADVIPYAKQAKEFIFWIRKPYMQVCNMRPWFHLRLPSLQGTKKFWSLVQIMCKRVFPFPYGNFVRFKYQIGSISHFCHFVF